MSLAQYLCPLCQSPLSLTQRSYQCTNNHCFDKAKEGYVNLLPVQFKHSINPGDNKQMVNARRQFLSCGHYQPLANTLVNLVKDVAKSEASLLDAGCGEGYYTHQFKQHNQTVYGIDIAKEAIKKSSKKLSRLPF